jgi:choline dehydrogenase-like flavoprotein
MRYTCQLPGTKKFSDTHTEVCNCLCFSGNCQRGEIDWQYKTTPQLHSHFGCINHQGNWPRGKVLGGCSSINYMQYVRGDPHDYDNWELPQWSFKDMLPYFKKLERADLNSIPKNEKFRNHDQSAGRCESDKSTIYRSM